MHREREREQNVREGARDGEKGERSGGLVAGRGGELGGGAEDQRRRQARW